MLIIDFSPPASTSACCFVDGDCNVLTATDCTNQGGTPSANPPEVLTERLGHRLQREAQVVTAGRSGPDTSPAMVEVLYADVRKGLHSPARRSVLAHLVKLVDGQVVVLAGEEPRPRLDSIFVAN